MKKIYLLVIILIFVAFSTSCGDIEDTNGDSTQLVTIDMDKLTGNSIGGSSSGFSSHTIRNNITIITLHEEIDFDSLRRTGGKSSGVFNILATEVKEGETLTIHCNTAVDIGNIGMVLISENYELIYEFEIGQSDSCTVTAPETQEYLVRLGAESFSGMIEVSRVID